MNINIYINLSRHNFQYQLTVQRFQKNKEFLHEYDIFT